MAQIEKTFKNYRKAQLNANLLKTVIELHGSIGLYNNTPWTLEDNEEFYILIKVSSDEQQRVLRGIVSPILHDIGALFIPVVTYPPAAEIRGPVYSNQLTDKLMQYLQERIERFDVEYIEPSL